MITMHVHMLLDLLLPSAKVVVSNSTDASLLREHHVSGHDIAAVFSYVTRTPANVSTVVAQGLDPQSFVVTTAGTLALGAGVVLPAYSLTTIRWVVG